MKRELIIGIFVLLFSLGFVSADCVNGITEGNNISQYGITWFFDKEYTCGTFVNGDFWVVGPVTIVNITPSPSNGLNGQMINPIPGNVQAYDSRQPKYNADYLNVPQFQLMPNESLVSAVSIQEFPYIDIIGNTINSNFIRLKTAAILTCLDTIPPTNAFRPPYVGSQKPVYTFSDPSLEKFPNLVWTGATANITQIERYLERPWIDHLRDFECEYMHPADNMPSYGRDYARIVGDAALLLSLNYSDQEKRKLAVSLTQLGIDNYHIALIDKNMWPVNGGHMLGRKFPIQFAGFFLGQESMLTLNDYINQEDNSTYYPDSLAWEPIDNRSLWTGWQDSGHPYATDVQYLPAMDWGGYHYNYENYPLVEWAPGVFGDSGVAAPYEKAEPYRRLATESMVGEAIAARILGLKETWSHDAFFYYVDRWMYEDDEAVVQQLVQEANDNNWVSCNATDCWPVGRSVDYWFPYGSTAVSKFAEEMYFKFRPIYGNCSEEGCPLDTICIDYSCNDETGMCEENWIAVCGVNGDGCCPPGCSNDLDCSIAMKISFEGNYEDSFSNFDGSPFGDPQFTAGKFGQGLELDGAGDYVGFGNGMFTQNMNKTIALWVKPNSENYNGAIYNLPGIVAGGSGYFGLAVGDLSGQNKIWAFNHDGNYDYVGIDYNNEWIHVALVHNGTDLTLYKNGILEGSVASGGTSNMLASSLYAGRGYNTGEFYNGLIDELVVYDRALTDSEIKDLYTGQQTQCTLTSARWEI